MDSKPVMPGGRMWDPSVLMMGRMCSVTSDHRRISIMAPGSTSHLPFGTTWDSGLWIGLTGDLWSRPMCQLVRGLRMTAHRLSRGAIDHDRQNVSGARETGSRAGQGRDQKFN